MKRIFGNYAYSGGPRDGCWWDQTCDMPSAAKLQGDRTVDVAIVGGGFTGVSAALQLASCGMSVALLESHFFGWGASGRNGGFCCLGGGIASDAELDKKFGHTARLEFRLAEKEAVSHIEKTIAKHGLQVDQHSTGETELAHRPKDMETLRTQAHSICENYGVEPTILEESDLKSHGIGGGPFFGALTTPIGFGVNPRKLLSGLVSAATNAGAVLFNHSPVVQVSRFKSRHQLVTPEGSVTADQVIFATNGYSSEDIPKMLANKYMPAQSNVLVTRALTSDELQTQGWTTDQMCFDSRNLLHYFRLLPDKRFLFGMRGGLLTGARAEANARSRTIAHFQRMFPKWKHLEICHAWSGMVGLARNKTPFVGELEPNSGLWCAMCYHGNGVAMGCFAGKLVANLVLQNDTTECPHVMRTPMSSFPFGSLRRTVMPPLYAGLMLKDRL